MDKPIASIYIRNFIFGVEDSLVSTVGLLSGIAVAGVPHSTLILTGVILIFVEAFSMGIGSFLSENTAEEARHDESRKPARGGFIMFISYFFAGFVPLFPYLFSSSVQTVWYSIGLSLLALYILGFVSGRLFHISPARSGLRMFALGGVAIAVGVIVGRLIPR
jgi:VIT1/CCC1 family predicted Fe2+/Mn2+ transporter